MLKRPLVFKRRYEGQHLWFLGAFAQSDIKKRLKQKRVHIGKNNEVLSTI